MPANSSKPCLIQFPSRRDKARVSVERETVPARSLRPVSFLRPYFHLLIAVDSFHREGGQADGDVLGSAFVRSRVLNPLAAVDDDGLSGGDLEGSRLVLHSQRAFEDDREFLELGSLAGLLPSLL